MADVAVRASGVRHDGSDTASAYLSKRRDVAHRGFGCRFRGQAACADVTAVRPLCVQAWRDDARCAQRIGATVLQTTCTSGARVVMTT